MFQYLEQRVIKTKLINLKSIEMKLKLKVFIYERLV